MVAYKKKYKKFYGHGDQDFVPCLICGSAFCDIHHIIPKSQGGKDDIGNLISLCRSCHDKAHAKEITAEQLFNKIR